MQLLINIDEDTYNNFVNNKYTRTDVIAMHNAIGNGKPLPKGHGNLIDVNELKKVINENDIFTMTGFNVRLCDINNTPIIIEADKEK